MLSFPVYQGVTRKVYTTLNEGGDVPVRELNQWLRHLAFQSEEFEMDEKFFLFSVLEKLKESNQVSQDEMLLARIEKVVENMFPDAITLWTKGACSSSEQREEAARRIREWLENPHQNELDLSLRLESLPPFPAKEGGLVILARDSLALILQEPLLQMSVCIGQALLPPGSVPQRLQEIRAIQRGNFQPKRLQNFSLDIWRDILSWELPSSLKELRRVSRATKEQVDGELLRALNRGVSPLYLFREKVEERLLSLLQQAKGLNVRMTRLNLGGVRVNGILPKILRICPDLRELSLAKCFLIEDALKALAEAEQTPKLRRLDLHGTSWYDTDNFLFAFLEKCTHLSELDMNTTFLSGTGLEYLNCRDTLRRLVLPERMPNGEVLRGYDNLEELELQMSRPFQSPSQIQGDLALLAGLTKLSKLKIKGDGWIPTEEGISRLYNLLSLKELDISVRGTAEQGGGHLRRALFSLPSLTKLALSGCFVAPEEVEQLSYLPKLESLYLSDVRIESEGIKKLPILSRLKELSFRVGGSVQARCGQDWAQYLPNQLKILRLSSLSSEEIKALQGSPSLEEFELSSCALGEEMFKRLVGLFPNVKKLHLNTVGMRNEWVGELSRLPLKELRLAYGFLDDSVLKFFGTMADLEVLDLSWNQLGPEGTKKFLSDLDRGSRLRKIDFEGNHSLHGVAPYLERAWRGSPSLEHVSYNSLYDSYFEKKIDLSFFSREG